MNSERNIEQGVGERGRLRRGAREYESWSGRMDGRTQTLKSARAIDAINGCVRLVAGKIDDEHRGAPYLAVKASTAAPPERMEQRPKYRFLGPYAAVRCSYLPRVPYPREAPFKTPTTRARHTVRGAAADLEDYRVAKFEN